MASPADRMPLDDLGRRLLPRLTRRWVEPYHVLVQRRPPRRAVQVQLRQVTGLRFFARPQTLWLAVSASDVEAVVDLLRLQSHCEASRTPAELDALADGLAGAPCTDAAAAVVWLRTQATFLRQPGASPMISPMASFVGEERRLDDLGWLP